MDERILSCRFPNFSLFRLCYSWSPHQSRSHFPFISKFQKAKAKVISLPIHFKISESKSQSNLTYTKLEVVKFFNQFSNSLEIFIISKCASILKYVQLNSPY